MSFINHFSVIYFFNFYQFSIQYYLHIYEFVNFIRAFVAFILKKVVILPSIRKGCRKAEIRPNEPDADNADVGRDSDFNLFTLFRF